MNKCRKLALDHFLADYPEWLSYDDIIGLVKTGNVTAWEPFKNTPGELLAEYIVDMVDMVDAPPRISFPRQEEAQEVTR